MSERTLRDPVMVAAFRGWNDAGLAASKTVDMVLEDSWSEELLTLGEEYYDLRDTRPQLVERDGRRELRWPGTTVHLVHLAARDLLLVTGDEPSLGWSRFTGRLVELAREHGISELVLVGAMNSDDPHTRPLPVYVDSNSPELAERFAVRRSDYVGPVGIIGVLAHVADQAGLDVLQVWGAVPYYAPEAEAVKATLALTRRLAEVLDITLVTDSLAERSQVWESAVSELVQSDPDMSEFVAGLEELHDSSLNEASGDEIASQIEDFLRGDRPN